MRRMPVLLALAVALIGAGAPIATLAQPSSPPLEAVPPPSAPADQPSYATRLADLMNSDQTLAQREQRLGDLLTGSVADGSLGHDEYQRTSTELTAIKASEDRARHRNHGELTDTDTFRLEGRLKTLTASIHWAR